jgi:hypothetical protein
MATVNKNFKVKHGLVVEGTTGTINGENILTESQDSQDFILDLIGGETLVKSVSNEFDVSAGGELSIDRTTVDAYYDAAGAAAAAEVAANSYTDGRETAITTAYEAYADTAEADAKAYTDTRETAITTAYEAYADTAEADAKAYADAEIASLVGGAPELLDTLNELAAALQDNPDVIADLQGIAAGKQDQLTAGANIDITEDTISVTGLDTDDVAEGINNEYFTDERAQDAVALAIAAGSHENIAITYSGGALSFMAENGVADSSTSDLAEGTNLYFTNQRALDATAAAYDVVGAAATAEGNANDYTDTEIGNLTTDDIEEGETNLYFTNQRALDATAAAYDVVGSGAGALTQANDYTDGEITTALTTAQGYADTAEADAISAAEAYTDGRETAITTAYEAYADQAEVDAKAYTDTRETAITTAYEAYADTAEADAKAYADAEIAALVNGAPELLDTLNELAAAIGDDENFAANLATSVGEKVAKAGDTMTGLLVLSADPSANLGAATKQYVDTAETDAVATAEAYTDGEITTALTTAQGYADTAESNAIAHADALTTDDVAEGSVNEYFTDARAVDALEAVVPNFTEVDINSVATQVAATGSATAATETTVYSFAKADYRSAKFLVKVAYSTHTEISEVLLTLDTSDNIAITEYAIVGTNGTLSAVSAAVSGANVNLLVTPTNTSTVTVMGTLLA